MAHYEEFVIHQGADIAIQIELEDENGGAKNLSNYSVFSSMKKSYNSSTSYDFNTIIVDPPAGGILTLSMNNTQTDAIPSGRYLYDTYITFVDSDGATVSEKILEGRIEVIANISSISGGE